MNITAESYGHAIVLIVKGEMIGDTLTMFRREVDRQLNAGDVVDVVLDLQGMTALDSEVLEYLLDLQDRLAEKFGQVKFARVQPHIRKILEITRLDTEFEIFQEPSEAIKVMQL